MDIEEAVAIHKNQQHRAAQLARIRLREMGLPQEINIPAEVQVLGNKINQSYKRIRSALFEEFGVDLPKIAAVALHEYWYACWNGASFFQVLIEDGEFNDNEYTRELATADGYADSEGWANTASNAFADIIPSPNRIECIRELTGHEALTALTTLNCLALYWFSQAAMKMGAGNARAALDLMHEAHDALLLNYSSQTWDDAWAEATRIAEESLGAKARSDLARKAGRAAHVETHALKAEIRDFWVKSIPASISNDAAAALLARQFPLTPRILSRYVAEFKNTVS